MVPRTMVPCATTNHVITDKIAQWYFVQRRHYGPAFQDCHPLTVPAQSWITVPVWLPRLNPEAEMLGPVAGGRLTSEEPCGTSPAPATPHWGDANKSGVSNLNTGIYLKIISWRENKTPSILAKLGEREVHLRLLQMKQRGSEEPETSACMLHSLLPRQVYEGVECL